MDAESSMSLSRPSPTLSYRRAHALPGLWPRSSGLSLAGEIEERTRERARGGGIPTGEHAWSGAVAFGGLPESAPAAVEAITTEECTTLARWGVAVPCAWRGLVWRFALWLKRRLEARRSTRAGPDSRPDARQQRPNGGDRCRRRFFRSHPRKTVPCLKAHDL